MTDYDKTYADVPVDAKLTVENFFTENHLRQNPVSEGLRLFILPTLPSSRKWRRTIVRK